MKTMISRLLQVFLLAAYAVGVLLVIFGLYDCISTIIITGIPSDLNEFRSGLAWVGIGAILTFVSRYTEALIVFVLKPDNSSFINFLSRPVSSIFRGHNA